MMNRACFRLAIEMIGLAMLAGPRLAAQNTSTPTAAAPKAAPAAAAEPTPTLTPAPSPTSASADTANGHTANPTPLQLQTEKLAAMAAELKARVAKSNKDVLSVPVIQQAQAIEQYAHELKQGDSKH
jgi:hypothetical protein